MLQHGGSSRNAWVSRPMNIEHAIEVWRKHMVTCNVVPLRTATRLLM